MFTEVMVSTKGDIDLWYEEANHEEAQAWLKSSLSTIARCSGINPNTDLPKIEEMFTEPARIVQYLEDEYSPMIIQKRQELMQMVLCHQLHLWSQAHERPIDDDTRLDGQRSRNYN
jgi:hypothetical protein